jgi:hypothetical protein
MNQDLYNTFETTERVIVIYLIACGCLSHNQKRNGNKVIFSFKKEEIEYPMQEYTSGKPALVDYRLVIFAENWFNTIIHEI